MTDPVMRHKHHCDKCKSMGQHLEYDLYFCECETGILVARYGDEKLQYLSGNCLVVADAMAKTLGYIK